MKELPTMWFKWTVKDMGMSGAAAGEEKLEGGGAPKEGVVQYIWRKNQ